MKQQIHLRLLQLKLHFQGKFTDSLTWSLFMADFSTQITIGNLVMIWLCQNYLSGLASFILRGGVVPFYLV